MNVSASIRTNPSQRGAAREDELEHWYCCDPNWSLCGRDLTDVPVAPFEEASCVVCEDLVDSICPRCGE